MKIRKLVKRLAMPFIAASMGAVMFTSAFAEPADDYEFETMEVVDFCVLNIWAESFVTPPQTVSSIWLSVDVSDYEGDPIDVKLYSREQVTWETHATEAQTIDGDGNYVFFLQFDEEYNGTDLCTIYLKDYLCALPDEDPEGQSQKESNVNAHFVLNDCRFNVDADGNDLAASDGGDEEISDGGEGDDAETPEVISEDTSEDKNDTKTTGATEKSDSSSEKKDESKSDNTLPIVIGIICGVLVLACIVIFAVKGKKK